MNENENKIENKYNPILQENYENLANAIILRAVEDYRLTEREENLLEIDRFFRSDWFTVLSKVDPEYLIRKLRKEKEQNEKKRIKRKWNRS